MPKGQEKITALYRNAGLKPPKGKGIHTMKFHRCVVNCAKNQGGKIHGKVNCHAVCMSSIGRTGAVHAAHQRKERSPFYKQIAEAEAKIRRMRGNR